MAQNPLRGVYLNNRFYEYVNDTFSMRLPLQNTVSRNSNGTFSNVLGATKLEFTLALSLDNNRVEYFGSTIVGTTTWLGVSRLFDLISYIATSGQSMPLTFVSPYGLTYSVVPQGELGIAEKLTTPREEGFEFRVDLTLVEV
jgi:hypothetical protein